MADDSCDKHHIFLFTVMPANNRAQLTQEIIHLNYLLLNESLFVVNIGILLGFYVGFPNVLIMNRFHFDLNLTFGTVFIFSA